MAASRTNSVQASKLRARRHVRYRHEQLLSPFGKIQSRDITNVTPFFYIDVKSIEKHVKKYLTIYEGKM